jgi:phosphohistidine phosphatase
MMKTLMLLRHAEAVGRTLHESDKERELTSKGISQSHQVGMYLSEKSLIPDSIFSSTAMRANQTATLVADAMKFENHRIRFDEELYDATTRMLFNFVTTIDDSFNKVLCVGHNPGISYLAEYLTKEPIGEMRPSGIAIISFDILTWKEVGEGTGELVRYVEPASVQNQ